MKVKKLSGKVQDARQIPTLFDNENIISVNHLYFSHQLQFDY